MGLADIPNREKLEAGGKLAGQGRGEVSQRNSLIAIASPSTRNPNLISDLSWSAEEP